MNGVSYPIVFIVVFTYFVENSECCNEEDSVDAIENQLQGEYETKCFVGVPEHGGVPEG